MTPSILAPLNAAPAKLSGPQTSDNPALAEADTGENTSFRDLVAQERQQTPSEGDRTGEQPPSGQGQESSAYDADEATTSRSEPLLASEETIGQGGQGLPAVAANILPNDVALQTDSLATPATAPSPVPGDANRSTAPSPVVGTVQGIATPAAPAAAAPGTGSAVLRSAGELRGDAAPGNMRSDVLNGGRRTSAWDQRSSDPGALAARQGERAPALFDGLRPMLGERSAFSSSLLSGTGPEGFGITPALGAQGGSATTVTAPATGANAINAALAPTTVFTVEPTATASSNPTSFELSQPLGSQAWQQELGGRLQWLTDARIGRAELRLNPAELGPLEITLNVRGDEVSATFGAQHAATREAVEQALPRLREMMAQSGLQLADANVGQHSGGEQAAQHDDGASAQRSAPITGADGAAVQTADLSVDSVSTRRTSIGQLDLYA
ncbi:MAG: flagellar hook-length control protein FliK [Pseudomonadota bacterium]